MDTKGTITAIVTIIVGVILTTGILMPIIGDASTTTISVDNEGAIGLRMDKVSSGDFTINYGLVGDDFTATNGTDTQVIDDPCIFYADNNMAVWMDDSSIIMLGKDASNNTIDEKLSDESTITITKSSAGLEITDGTITQTFPVPTWAYIPKSTGSYGFFLNETEINTGGLPVQYVGSFAGVNCYNSINSFDLPITIDAALTDSVLSGARWIGQATETAPEELNPDDLHIIPLDPSIIDIDPEPDTSIMAVPTPTYTDGDWGYDIVNGTTAKIVSYSGTGGDITVPSTVGGYPVTQLGKNNATQSASNYVMTNSQLLSDTTLTIPDSVKIIGAASFQASLTKLVSVNLPDGITIGRSAFFNSGLKSINIPDNAILYGYAFQMCSSATTLTIGENVNFAEGNIFKTCSNITGTVIIPETTTFGNTASGIFEGCVNVNNFVIPEGITALYTGGNSFYNCYSWVKNDLIIPDGTPALGYETFYNCSALTGKLIIPESVKTISSQSFYYVTHIDTLISLMDNDTVISSDSFSRTTDLKTILNLGSLELTTTSYGLNADTIRSDIPALGYLAPTQYKETVQNDGPASVLLNVIPLLVIIGLLIATVTMFIKKQ